MKVFENYSEYKRENKFYDDWKKARNDIEAKRAAYIAQEGVSEKQKKSDIRRAEAVLNSIDVMDEFSQARSEDMEIVTAQLKGYVYDIGMFLSMGIGAVLFKGYKPVNEALRQVFKHKNYKPAPKLILPAIITTIPIVGSIICASVWGAGAETKASRLGRAEAINQKLYSPNQFAELTDEQEKQVEEIAEGIHLTPKEAKKKAGNTRGFGIFKSFRTMFLPKESERKTIENINRRILSDQKNFDEIELNEKEILEAKRDQQLIQNVVEKIDIASQEYAENVELATSAVTTTALGGGVLVAFITRKILKKLPELAKFSKTISIITGTVLALGTSIYAAKFQKQASRVGRYKVKQDFRNNPEKLIYVDDDKAQTQNGEPYKKEQKRPKFFKFLKDVVKDNREYNRYLKTEFVESQKKSMAREQIELSEEQKQRAEQLQLNTFKMFNKLDEKSQAFSESTEAIGEMTSGILTSIISLAGLGLTALIATGNTVIKGLSKNKLLAITYAPAVISVLIAIMINVFVTKEQKRASKVANMLAINDLNDYRNFANYSKLPQDVK